MTVWRPRVVVTSEWHELITFPNSELVTLFWKTMHSFKLWLMWNLFSIHFVGRERGILCLWSMPFPKVSNTNYIRRLHIHNSIYMCIYIISLLVTHKKKWYIADEDGKEKGEGHSNLFREKEEISWQLLKNRRRRDHVLSLIIRRQQLAEDADTYYIHKEKSCILPIFRGYFFHFH